MPSEDGGGRKKPCNENCRYKAKVEWLLCGRVTFFAEEKPPSESSQSRRRVWSSTWKKWTCADVAAVLTSSWERGVSLSPAAAFVMQL